MSPPEHQALLEAMEQQRISVAKAGIVCSLPARASVIAAANPVGGHYNRAKTVAENLKMSAPILSRFDLIFILLDAPDATKDRLLSRHVMAMHGAGRGGGARGAMQKAVALAKEQWANQPGHEDWEASRPLAERLVVSDNDFDPLPSKLLRRYIEYARAYVQPRLSDEACALLKQFYLQLRGAHRGSGCGAITTRQLESLMRLSEARAKLELLEEVSAEHVQDVIDIMRESLYYDHMADLSMQVVASGGWASGGAGGGLGIGNRTNAGGGTGSVAGLSKTKLSKRFLDLLEQVYMGLPGVDVGQFDNVLEDLNQKSYVLKKGGGNWKLTSIQLALSAGDTAV
mmetsp:Transcript_17733/g.42050  ORF Transcript_17733/g.42050 Transcript_17733/m.42050 type:complete len:342 (-) Transcript_17733:62-1087(-)